MTVHPVSRRARWACWLVVPVAGVLLLPVTTAVRTRAGEPPATRPAETRAAQTRPTDASIEDEYRKRAATLGDDDVEGHYALAAWCREQERYDLAYREAVKVLRANPSHVNGRLLYDLAVRKLRERQAKAGLGPGGVPRLTRADILRLQLLELRIGGDRPDRVRVNFARGFEERFARQTIPAAEQRAFLRASAMMKLDTILHVAEERRIPLDAFVNDIELIDDPLVFRQFRRSVLPPVLKTCATAECHGGSSVEKVRLIDDAKNQAAVYTNFYVLDATATRYGRIIDRDKPAESLLVQYGLARQFSRNPHPKTAAPITPFIESPRSRTYRAVVGWIDLLKRPKPIYGIRLEGVQAEPPPNLGPPPEAAEERATAPPRR